MSREDANLQKDTSWVIPLGEPGDESAQLRQMTEYNLSVDLSATGLPVNFSAISPNTLYAAQVKKTRVRKKGGSAAGSENSKEGQTPSSHLSQIFHYQLWKNVECGFCHYSGINSLSCFGCSAVSEIISPPAYHTW